MKILLYGINFTPELTGIGKYTGEMAAWLAGQGHAVRVVTAPPYYPDWKVGAGFRNGWTTKVMDCHGADAPGNDGDLVSSLRAQRGNPGSLLVYRCPLWVPAKPGGATRLLHLASFALSSLPVMLRQIFWRPDVVWVVEPPLFCAPAAWAVARLTGASAWLHIQDYEVDAAFSLGLLKGQRLQRFVAAGERWLMRRFDVVSTISQRMLARAQAKGVDAARCRMLPNWVELQSFAAVSASGAQAYRRELGLPATAVVAMYSGNMGAKQGLEVLAEAAKLCAASPIFFVFCGNGVGRADLVARCQGLAQVLFIDLQPAERLPDLLAMADIHLLPQRADAADLVMPSKLTGMLASARPVVATANPGTELASVVQGCGLVVPPDHPRALADAMLALATDADRRAQLGAAGRRYAAQHMDRDAVLKDFEAALQALAKS